MTGGAGAYQTMRVNFTQVRAAAYTLLLARPAIRLVWSRGVLGCDDLQQVAQRLRQCEGLRREFGAKCKAQANHDFYTRERRNARNVSQPCVQGQCVYDSHVLHGLVGEYLQDVKPAFSCAYGRLCLTSSVE